MDNGAIAAACSVQGLIDQARKETVKALRFKGWGRGARARLYVAREVLTYLAGVLGAVLEDPQEEGR